MAITLSCYVFDTSPHIVSLGHDRCGSALMWHHNFCYLLLSFSNARHRSCRFPSRPPPSGGSSELLENITRKHLSSGARPDCAQMMLNP